MPRHKSFYILPNLFTTASLFLGFLGIIWTSAGHYDRVALLIIFGMFMDGLDGKVARLTNTSTEFGIQYDSLADLVTFGVAPAFLMYNFALHNFGRAGIAVAFLFVVCAALRLARFNVTTSPSNKRFFSGLPSPPAGCTLGCFVFFSPLLPSAMQDAIPWVCLFYTAMVALLMVSNIRYASFKEFGVFRAHPFRSVFLYVVLPIALIIASPRIFCFMLTLAYVVSGLVHTYVVLPRMAKAANRAAEKEASQAAREGHE
jgi:CDP-diacylglycerol--serine O-phosphatidyltransferase